MLGFLFNFKIPGPFVSLVKFLSNFLDFLYFSFLVISMLPNLVNFLKMPIVLLLPLFFEEYVDADRTSEFHQ